MPQLSSSARPSLLASAGLAIVFAALPVEPRSPFPSGVPIMDLVRAQARENVSIPAIEIKAGELATLTLKNVNVIDSSLGKAEVQALLEGAGTGFADRFAKFDAAKATVETLEWTMSRPEQEMKTVYRGFEATNIKAGTIGKLTIRGADIDQTVKAAKTQTVTGKMGPASIEAIDLPLMIRWMTESDPAGQSPLKVLHGAYSIDSYEFTMPEATMKMGKMTSSGTKVKLMPKPFSEFMALVAEAEKNKDDPAAAGKMFGMLEGMLGSFEFSDARIDGMSATGKNPDGKPFEMKMGAIAFSGGVNPGGSVDGVAIKADDGFFNIRKLRSEGDLFAILLTAVRSVLPAGTEGAGAPAKALNAYSFVIEGIDADMPDNAKKRRDGKAERVKFTMASFETRGGNFVGPTPADVGLSLRNFVLPIPADTTDSNLKELRASGFDKIDLSARINGRWQQAGNVYAIEEISVDLANMAKATLTGNLGNITRAMFDGPSEARMLAALAGNIQNATLTLTNLGIADKAIAKIAKDQKKNANQLKTEVSLMGPAMIGMVLSDHPDAKAVADAVGKFLTSFGTLTLKARAADGGGITAADFAAAASPVEVLKKVRLEATAQ